MDAQLDPERRTWHITFGTYGARLHGDDRPTVDRRHNQRGEPFLPPDPERERLAQELLRFAPVILTTKQRGFIEESLVSICQRGGWPLRAWAAGPDHVHVMIDIAPEIHGEKARRLIKRWLGQALSERWPVVHGATWWAEEGSNRPIYDVEYLQNAIGYIEGQRATPVPRKLMDHDGRAV